MLVDDLEKLAIAVLEDGLKTFDITVAPEVEKCTKDAIVISQEQYDNDYKLFFSPEGTKAHSLFVEWCELCPAGKDNPDWWRRRAKEKIDKNGCFYG